MLCLEEMVQVHKVKVRELVGVQGLATKVVVRTEARVVGVVKVMAQVLESRMYESSTD
jgi:hypothetical protein